jgi:hypothetical protein
MAVLRRELFQVYLNYLSDSHPAEAAPWTSQFSEERDRHSYIERIARRWISIDREAARAWLAETSLPDDRKHRIVGDK